MSTVVNRSECYGMIIIITIQPEPNGISWPKQEQTIHLKQATSKEAAGPFEKVVYTNIRQNERKGHSLQRTFAT